MIYNLGNLRPNIAEDVFIAPDANVIGDVRIGSNSSIWFSCTVRGDVHSIEIGCNVNVQDQSMLHVTGGKHPLLIKDHCTLGHRVVLHGCTLEEHAFIGIGAIVMDGCIIGHKALVGAGSLVTPGKIIPPRMVVMGSPAKIIREITSQEEEMIESIPIKYAQLKNEYMNSPSFPLSK